jgi:two-component system, NarL family, invasion response regulator UvrY
MKFLIIDDHQITRRGLINYLQEDYPEALFDEAYDGAEGLANLSKNEYDLVILDIALPVKDGVEVYADIKSRWPQTPVLAISGFTNGDKIAVLYDMGVAGYLSKRVVYEELKLAVRTLLQGKRYFNSSSFEAILKYKEKDPGMALFDQLSPQQKKIALMLASGYSIKEIHEKLFIAESTVYSHKSTIMEKMGFKEDAELTLYCIKHGLVKVSEKDHNKQ